MKLAPNAGLRDPPSTRELVAFVSQVYRSYFIIHDTLANIRVNNFCAYFSYKLLDYLIASAASSTLLKCLSCLLVCYVTVVTHIAFHY